VAGGCVVTDRVLPSFPILPFPDSFSSTVINAMTKRPFTVNYFTPSDPVSTSPVVLRAVDSEGLCFADRCTISGVGG
jgi:hypothetical protein